MEKSSNSITNEAISKCNSIKRLYLIGIGLNENSFIQKVAKLLSPYLQKQKI